MIRFDDVITIEDVKARVARRTCDACNHVLDKDD
jgi:hypothetical protein